MTLRFAREILPRFTRDLTADARAGRLEPVRCRDAEVSRLVDILLRHGKNNPVLVGDAGVGKTAIVEGLAQRVAAGALPLSLRDVRILALDHVSLLGGTQYRGQYEERISAIVAETSAAGDVILFIDELHNLMGQGTAMGAAMDAANMLKPALVRGEFRVIGATTGGEYDRWIRADPALERRFQLVTVGELGPEDTLEVLRARAPGLERHHVVLVHDSAVVAALRLSDIFLPDRRRPDRAIDVLDEACAHLQATANLSPAVESLVRELAAARRGSGAAGEGARSSGAPANGDRQAPDPPGRLGDLDGESFGDATRQGLAALERFGAELESLFGGGWIDDARFGEAGGSRREPAPAARRSEPAPKPEHQPAAPRSTSGTRPIAVIEDALRRALEADGIVVRGHDVARVISLITGKSVTWKD